MPLDTLRDAAGRAVATFTPDTREGRPLADYVVRAPDVTEEDLVAAILDRLPGSLVGTEDLALGAALERAGAQRRRFAHTMTLDLRAGPPFAAPPPSGVAIEPLGEIADDLGAACAAAYPPGHPDHRTTDPVAATAELRRLAGGEEVGPLLAASRVALQDGRQVGAAIVTDSPSDPPEGGPWLVEMFRAPDPGLAGLGAALLAEAIAAARADGLATLGLAVSDGLAAHGLYARAGLRIVSSAVIVRIPGPAPDPPGG